MALISLAELPSHSAACYGENGTGLDGEEIADVEEQLGRESLKRRQVWGKVRLPPKVA